MKMPHILKLLSLSILLLLLALASLSEVQPRCSSPLQCIAYSFLNSSSIIEQRMQQDQRFQRAAFRAFDHHKTGRVYNVSSSPLVQAIRLRTRSLKRHGLYLNEFSIFPGCHVQASVKRVLVVYENLGLSDLLFPVKGYQLVGPVIGIFAYDASDLTTQQPLLKLSVGATKRNISIAIPFLQSSGNAGSPLCASFQTDNLEVVVSNLSSAGVCEATHFGFFSLVAKSFPPPPPPPPLPLPPPPVIPLSLAPPPSNPSPSSHHGISRSSKIVAASVAGAVALAAFSIFLTCIALKYKRQQRLATMEHHADHGESLQTSLVGNTRVPAAGFTRTEPMLENEYVA